MCRETPSGRTYIGHVNETVTGRPCQRWSSDAPHGETSSYTDNKFADGSRQSAENYCRNPDSDWWDEAVWCYTTDPSVLWEPCDVPECGEAASFMCIRYLLDSLDSG